MFHRGGIINEKVVDVHQISHLHTEESRNKKKKLLYKEKGARALENLFFFSHHGAMDVCYSFLFYL